MENTSIIALSRRAVLDRKMGILANNLANMNTTGFKGEKMMFVEHIERSKGGTRILGDRLSYVRDIATFRDTEDGPLKKTSNPLDLAVQGDAYFAVKTDLGDRYTRNGHFRLDETGQLVTQTGEVVLSDADQPIIFSPQDSEIIVTPDGTVSTENGELGKLKLVRFENQQGLRPVSNGLYAAASRPEAVENPNVVQGMLEGSNVKPIIELTRLIETQRAYDGVRSFIDREDERQKKMIEELTKEA